MQDFDSQLQVLFQVEAPYFTPHCVTLIRWSSVSTVTIPFCLLGSSYLPVLAAKAVKSFCESYSWHFDTCILNLHNATNQNLQMVKERLKRCWHSPKGKKNELLPQTLDVILKQYIVPFTETPPDLRWDKDTCSHVSCSLCVQKHTAYRVQSQEHDFTQTH